MRGQIATALVLLGASGLAINVSAPGAQGAATTLDAPIKKEERPRRPAGEIPVEVRKPLSKDEDWDNENPPSSTPMPTPPPKQKKQDERAEGVQRTLDSLIQMQRK